jgi:hypothetical protein
MTTRLTFDIPDALVRRTKTVLTAEIPVPSGSLATSAALLADYDETAHRGEAGADACTYRTHDVDHPATIRLTPDPDLPEAPFAHQDVLTVCRCCAYEGGHLYEEMRGEARVSGHVEVELRQADGSWLA